MTGRPRCGNDPRARLTPGDRAAVANFRAFLTARAEEKKTVTALEDARAALRPFEIISGFVDDLRRFEAAVRANERAGAEVRRLGAPDAVLAVLPDRSAALAEDLRYVLDYRSPGHAHNRPGVWDTSGKPCGHCARLAVARRNLAAYDAAPATVPPASDGRAALREARARIAELEARNTPTWRERAEKAEAVLPAPVDRAAVLREGADALGRMDYDTDSNDYGYDTYRDAWNGGVMDGAGLLRRLADETPQPEPDGAGEPAELRGLPREVRHLVHAVDRMRRDWAAAPEHGPERREMWTAVHAACDAVWNRPAAPAVTQPDEEA